MSAIINHSQISGRSMIEMIGVLTIIGVLSAGGIVSYSKAMRRHRLNETISQIAVMATNVRSFYGNTDNYESFNAQTAIKYNIATERMIGTDNALVNEYKGDIIISLGKAGRNGPDNTAFILTYTNLPVEACVGLALTDWGYHEEYGFLGVSVGYGNQEPNYPDTPDNYFIENRQRKPMSITEAAQHCNGTDVVQAISKVSLKFY